MHRVKLSVGVWDALSARLAERAGFELLFLSGFALAGTQLAEPDFGLLTQTETLEAARRITAAVRAPLVVDGDTGHGGPLNAQRLVRELVRIGAAGVLLEDQVWPKRCGHMRGKDVIGVREMCKKIEAAVKAKKDPDFIINARTDAIAVEGIEGAVARARAYASAGADMIYPDAIRSEDDIRRIVDAVPELPVNINMG
ncbi:MAG TPA: isocitrate lyase/PEP mutase family protein, partial [Myxococcota bacterium]|nr:isocitrate lyase/PEP mutase family protein [Myxococcota bacterium]